MPIEKPYKPLEIPQIELVFFRVIHAEKIQPCKHDIQAFFE